MLQYSLQNIKDQYWKSFINYEKLNVLTKHHIFTILCHQYSHNIPLKIWKSTPLPLSNPSEYGFSQWLVLLLLRGVVIYKYSQSHGCRLRTSMGTYGIYVREYIGIHSHPENVPSCAWKYWFYILTFKVHRKFQMILQFVFFSLKDEIVFVTKVCVFLYS